MVDGFGLAMIPPAIIQRDLANGDVCLLQIDTEMPDMSLVCSYRSGPETSFFNRLRLQRNKLRRISLGVYPDVARMPAAAHKPD
jgi:hypothetical protein